MIPNLMTQDMMMLRRRLSGCIEAYAVWYYYYYYYYYSLITPTGSIIYRESTMLQI